MTLLARLSNGAKATGLATGIKKPAEAGLSRLIAELFWITLIKLYICRS